jgi:hypothetical protein
VLDCLFDGAKAPAVEDLRDLDLGRDAQLTQDGQRIEVAGARRARRAVEVAPQGVKDGVGAVGAQIEHDVIASCGVQLADKPARIGDE